MILELKHKTRTVCTLRRYLSEKISTAVGDEQQINLAILNLEEAAKGSLIMLVHKYTFFG